MDVDSRDFFKKTGVDALALSVSTGYDNSRTKAVKSHKRGNQRLSVKQLQAWENLHYGMFIHFGMSTFTGYELSDGKTPSATYVPDRLDVDQWISVARDAGMKYAVLTTKHVAGYCLWPSEYTDYSAKTSADKTDVVEKFVRACEMAGARGKRILPARRVL